MKKLLFYESRPEWGGAQKCELDLLIGLENSRLKTYFLTSTNGPMVERVKKEGKPVMTIPINQSVDSIRKGQVKSGLIFAVRQLLPMVPHLWKVLLFLMKNRIDLVYTSQMRSQMIIGLLARLARKKVIWHIHGQEKLDNWLGKLCMLTSNKIIVVSNEIAKSYQHLFPQYRDKIISLHNGMDVDSTPMDEASLPPSELVSLVTVGSLLFGKRQDLLIRAVGLLKEEGLPVRLHIVGEKPDWHPNDYKDSLYELADSLQISEQVTFWGWVEKPQAVLGLSDLFVLPSDTEGLPLSMIEAMAMRLPCIATNVGGNSELIVDRKTGILVAPGNVADLAAAIKCLVRDPMLREQMGKKSRERYEQYFTRKDFLEGVEGVIHTIL